MSKIAKSSINWAELEKLVPPHERPKFLAFKTKSDGYVRRMLANPEKPPEIDWEYYRKTVPVAGLVDKFKEQYEKVSIPYPEDTLSSEVDAQWASLKPEIEAQVKEMEEEIKTAQAEIARLNAIPKFEEMTLETYYKLNPDVAVKFVDNPQFWPCTIEEQYGYESPAEKAARESGGGEDHH